MGNTDKNKAKKCRRKIRIRLADPNVPDSYVCEIFDSSLENEEENSKNDEASVEKPKNYFELLMPKKCKKNRVIKGVNQNEDLSYSSDEEFEKNKLKNKKNLNSLTHSRNVKSETSSLKNKSQIQEKFKVKTFDLHEDNDCIIEVNKERICNEDHQHFSQIDPPKVEPSQKKALGILGYFSKTQANQKNKENSNSEGITELRHSLKTCETEKQLKAVKQHDTAKTQLKNVSLLGFNKENVKLAPLFYKKENKVIDSATQKARLEFLYKSLPSNVKKSENKTSEYVLNIFPKISHVQQRNENVCWSHRQICLPLPEVSVSENHTFKNNKKFSLHINHFSSVNNAITNCGIKINKEFLCKVKCKYLELNLDCIIDGLKEKKDKFLARTKEVEQSKTRHQDLIDGFEELNVLWTDKYKPKSCEILGNENIVKKMKKWLELWKLFDEDLKALVKTSRNSKNQNDSSDDDFLDSDNENYGLKAPGNVCIIYGPNGCGKTALVYALANELEFGVLELNASSKRTGKKVLSDLQEATQSHKVHRVNPMQSDVFNSEIMKKKRSRKKKKTKKLEPNKIFHQSNDSKISLILIEDADIVFDEHDEGFFSAIASLVQTSKRPIIFLSNERNCHDLYNLKADQCLILEMEMPNFYISCAILDIVSSLEGVHFEKEIIESLVRQNNCDLRRSLLQVQFWIHSGKTPVNFERKFDLGHLWWGLSQFLYKQDIKHFVKSKSRKRKRVNELFDSSDEEIEVTKKKFKPDAVVSKPFLLPSLDLMQKKSRPSIESYFKVLDLASVLDEFSLPGSQEPIPGFQCKEKDGLCLDENMEDVTWSWKTFKEQVSEELVNLSAKVFVGKKKENENWKISFVPPCWEEIQWRNSQKKAAQELSTLVSLHRGRDKRSLHLDYLPILRNICRVERNRSEMNPRRKNRFYHYLNNLGFELTDENLEINCDIFYQ